MTNDLEASGDQTIARNNFSGRTNPTHVLAEVQVRHTLTTDCLDIESRALST